MSSLDILFSLSKTIVKARKDLRLNQSELAKMVGVSRDLIIRMEKADNVGIHHICKVLAVLNKKVEIVEDNVVEGSFDEYYEKTFGESIKKNLGFDSEGNHKNSIFKRSHRSLLEINWKQAAKI
jgi:transcriptional regulator with XRE-family HTH domain